LIHGILVSIDLHASGYQAWYIDKLHPSGSGAPVADHSRTVYVYKSHGINIYECYLSYGSTHARLGLRDAKLRIEAFKARSSKAEASIEACGQLISTKMELISTTFSDGQRGGSSRSTREEHLHGGDPCCQSQSLKSEGGVETSRARIGRSLVEWAGGGWWQWGGREWVGPRIDRQLGR
jgi:hypothetical protein